METQLIQNTHLGLKGFLGDIHQGQFLLDADQWQVWGLISRELAQDVLYDLNSNRTSMTDPTGTTYYEYDALNRLTKITNPNGEITTFSYDAISRRTGMGYANGVTASYSYDDAGRLLSLVNQIGATTVTTFSYSYDKVGNRTSMTDTDGTHNYLYDQLYRLIDATHPQPANPAENFDYDSVGNRLTSADYTDWTYDANNRLMSYDGVTYAYDNNGSLTSKADTTGTTTYTYDAENRLIQVTTPTDAVSYQYDGLGRRIAKTVNGVVTKFVYDERDVLLDLDENDQIKARYTRTLSIDELISVDRDTDGDGTLDATYYYHRDGLGSVTAMTDIAGAVVQSYIYDSFGNIKSAGSGVENRYTYTSREWDGEAGLYYYRARFYSADIGRFVTEDPIHYPKVREGDNANLLPASLTKQLKLPETDKISYRLPSLLTMPQELNSYVYVGNNPINAIDPTGELIRVAAVVITTAVVTGTIYLVRRCLKKCINWDPCDLEGWKKRVAFCVPLCIKPVEFLQFLP